MTPGMRLGAAAAAAVLAAVPAAGQDVEALAALSGRPLPAGYYARLRENPGFFQHERVWPRRVAAEAGDGAPAAAVVVQGNLRMVVMMGTFSDSPEPAVSAAQVHERLFGDNPAGNLTDFYHLLSGGRLTIEGAVLPWVRTRLTRAEVSGRSFGLGADGGTGWFLRDVAAAVDGLTDFGRFDNDGPDGVPNSGDDDGHVDLAVFQISEPAASCGAATIWPHRSALSDWLGVAYATDDLRPDGVPVVVDQYHLQSAVNCDGTAQNISTIAHETGHAFGLPDFYDAGGGILPHQRRWVVGCFSLMAAGAWGCGDGSTFVSAPTPAHMSPYEKMITGWANLVYAVPGWRREYTLEPAQASGQALFVSLRPGNEFLLLEYRPNTGFDAHLPAGGILAYHVDQNRPYRIDCMGCRRAYHMSLLEADGDTALLRTAAEGGNRGVAGDVFTGRRVLDDHTTPSLRQNSGLPSNVRVEMEVVDGRARLVVSMLPVVAPPRLLAPLLGSAGAGPADDERLALDLFGNRNGRYDLGDLRAYMRSRPGTVVPG
jgi:M6 family metalloprotease-like protein